MYITPDRMAWLFSGVAFLILIAGAARSLLRQEDKAHDARLFLDSPLNFLYGVVGIGLAICFMLWLLGVGKPLGVWTVIALVAWATAGIVGQDRSIRRQRR